MLNLIRTSKTRVGKSDMTSGDKFRIRLTRADQPNKSISFYYNDNYLNKSKKEDFVYAMFTDMSSYDNYSNLPDFADAFGYEVSEAKSIFMGCARHSSMMHKLFSNEELNKLDDELRELNY